jgi:hypothetical protein
MFHEANQQAFWSWNFPRSRMTIWKIPVMRNIVAHVCSLATLAITLYVGRSNVSPGQNNVVAQKISAMNSMKRVACKSLKNMIRSKRSLIRLSVIT